MIFQNLTTKMREGSKSPLLIKVLKLSFTIILLIHFFVLAIYQMPANPVNHQYKYEIESYVNPFFSQTWTLFAPNPVSSNMSLLMRFNFENDKKRDTTQWIDISEPLINERHNSFFSPVLRINKFTQSCMSDLNSTHSLVLSYIKKTDSIRTDSLKSVKFYNQTMESCYGFQSLVEYSKYVAYNYFLENNLSPQHIEMQYRIIDMRFPRFSKRKEDYYNLDKYIVNELSYKFIKIK